MCLCRCAKPNRANCVPYVSLYVRIQSILFAYHLHFSCYCFHLILTFVRLQIVHTPRRHTGWTNPFATGCAMQKGDIVWKIIRFACFIERPVKTTSEISMCLPIQSEMCVHLDLLWLCYVSVWHCLWLRDWVQFKLPAIVIACSEKRQLKTMNHAVRNECIEWTSRQAKFQNSHHHKCYSKPLYSPDRLNFIWAQHKVQTVNTEESKRFVEMMP